MVCLKGIPEETLDTSAYNRRVSVARYIKERSAEPMKSVVAEKKSDLSPFVEVSDTADRGYQFARRCLEKFVTWVLFKNGHHDFPVVAERVKSKMFDDRGDLVAQYGNVGWASAVRASRPESQKAVFANDAPLLIEDLDTYIVHRYGSMNS